MTLRVYNWDKFQHYKDRDPPWIKLHKRLLDNPDWHTLPDRDAKALISLWLIASENKGELPEIDVLAFRLRLASKIVVDICKSLVDNGFLVDASGVLAECLHDARPEERRGEAEAEEDLSVDDEKGGDRWPPKPEKRNGQFLYPQPFEQAWAVYPDRRGSNPKAGAYRAFRARVKDGEDPDDLIASAGHYRDFCDDMKKTGTEYVAQAATFWGPRDTWREYVEKPEASDGRKERYPRLHAGSFPWAAANESNAA